MGSEIIDKIDQYIQTLAEKLGVAAEHVYELLARQQIAEGIATVSLATIGLLFIFSTIIIVLRKGFDKYTDRWNDEVIDTSVGNIVKFVFLGISALILMILLITLPDIKMAILQIINPEYYAIREILDVFKGK